ncbi:MAG: hypothetical protein PVI57_14665 [Gemmatimonadota bacterium]
MTRAISASFLVAALAALACGGGPPPRGSSTPSAPSLPSLDCSSPRPWESEGSEDPPGLVNLEAVADSVARGQAGSEPARNAAMVTMRVTRRGTVDRACLETSSGLASFEPRSGPRTGSGSTRQRVTETPCG